MQKILVTGGAGFIGSHLVGALVELGHEVVVYDDLSTGSIANIEHVRNQIGFWHYSILDFKRLIQACRGVDAILHQAAFVSLPESMKFLLRCTEINVMGTLGVLMAAKEAGVRRVVVASTSAIYGGSAADVQSEGDAPSPRSPYAVSKLAAEEYCRLFTRAYGLETVCLRYFNVFGPRQSPDSQYAAVIPKFISCILKDEPPPIYGDGHQSRDFVYVGDVAQANLKALAAPAGEVAGKVFNVGRGEVWNLFDLLATINRVAGKNVASTRLPAREGDARKSCALITAARDALGYQPRINLEDGIRETVRWMRQACAV